MIIKKKTNSTIQKSAKVTVKAGVDASLVIPKSGIYTIDVERNASIRILSLIKNSRKLDQRLVIRLIGTGADAMVAGAFHGTGAARHNFNVTMHHKARHTKGNIFLKGVYEDNSRGFFAGLIKIGSTATHSNSYFTDNILLLDESMATSIPTLEIETDEVKASHSSTTGTIDDNQLFYLTSRGLNNKQAKRMIIDGFLRQALKLPI